MTVSLILGFIAGAIGYHYGKLPGLAAVLIGILAGGVRMSI